MKRYLALILCTFLMAGAQPATAQKEARSLLWRITGKGMAHPSYLFGTFHVRTKKLFNFPDSLYTAIAQSEVFALEVNPDSMNSGLSAYLSQIVDEQVQKAGPKTSKKLRDILSKEELDELKDGFAGNTGIDVDELTPQQAYAMKDKLIKHPAQPDDMPTFMDAYLYRIARDNGRAIGGLEQLSDQMKLLSNPALLGVDTKKAIDILKKGGSLDSQMMKAYLEKDLEQLLKIAGMFNAEAEEALLTTRNKVMLHSMDSIMRHQSLFAAVGSLHLPGEKGLIALLRQQGYQVEPVICPTTTNGADYHFKNSSLPWVTVVVEADGYSIKMPGQPGDVDAYDGKVKMKSYYDIDNSRYYLVLHVARPPTATVSTASVIASMQKTVVKTSGAVEMIDIANNGMDGKEYFYSDKDSNRYHLQIFGNNTDVYMLMAYSTNWSIRHVDSFFKSFKALHPPAQQSAGFDGLHAGTKVPLTGAQPVLWQNNWDVNYSIPQQVSFSTDSKYLAVGYPRGNIIVYEAATGNVFTNYHAHDAHVYCTVFQPGGTLLASGGKDGTLVLYDYLAGKLVQTIAAHDQVIKAITFSSDGKLLATGGRDNTIKIWDVASMQVLRTIERVTGNIAALNFSHDNKTVIAGTSALSKGLRLFDVRTGDEIEVFESANLQSLALAADGHYIATANLNKNVQVYDFRKYKWITELNGHDKWLRCVTFSPTSKILYSGADDGQVIAWDMDHLNQIGTVFSTRKKIASVACSPNGLYLAVFDESGNFSVLDIDAIEKGK